MTKKFPLHPLHPERICWGCDKYCPADALACGNGSVATLHPSELFGEDWMSWGLAARRGADDGEASQSSGTSGGSEVDQRGAPAPPARPALRD